MHRILLFMVICCAWLCTGTGFWPNKKIYKNRIEVYHTWRSSIVYRDAMAEGPNPKVQDKLYVHVYNCDAPNPLAEAHTALVNLTTRDTLWNVSGFWRDSTDQRNFTTGEFMLLVYATKPLYKRMALPITIIPFTQSSYRHIAVHLGSYAYTRAFEITSTAKLTRAEKDSLHERLYRQYDNPVTTDVFGCDAVKLNSDFICGFWNAKNCTIKEIEVKQPDRRE
ncbi:MAG TPA: hypothetical protein VD905_05515 [Flavobacteriales bacterium]|nr:hypothetical protein [Flavobacteriales bacterium]